MSKEGGILEVCISTRISAHDHGKYQQSYRTSKFIRRAQERLAHRPRCGLHASQRPLGEAQYSFYSSGTHQCHLYRSHYRKWKTDETIVKIEKSRLRIGPCAFVTEEAGAASAFQSPDGRGLPNYSRQSQKTVSLDTSEEAKQSVQNDIMLQYEAHITASSMRHASAQDSSAPTRLNFLTTSMSLDGRLNAIEGRTNAHLSSTIPIPVSWIRICGVSPQVFSAHSFTVVKDKRLVADIQVSVTLVYCMDAAS
jgi:hypothetical protein